MSENNSFGSRMMGNLRDGASKKLLAFVVLTVVGTVGYVMWSSKQDAADQIGAARLGSVPGSGNSFQGGSTVNPAYEEALRQADQNRINAARSNLGSSMPTVVARSQNTLPAITIPDEPQPAPPPSPPPEIVRPVPRVADPPPLSDRPRPAPPPVQTGLQTPVGQPPQQQVPQGPVVDQASLDAFRQQMNQILGASAPGAAKIEYFYNERETDERRRSATMATGPSAVPVASPQPVAVETQMVEGRRRFPLRLPLPGSVIYAQMMNRANSDAPGPVIARVLQGPLTGAILLGSFQAAEESLVIKFDRLSMESDRDGREINMSTAVDAVGVDTKYVGTALATSVDRHLFSKIALGFGTSFLQGIGQAIAQSGTTTFNSANGSIVQTNPVLSSREKALMATGQAAGTAGQILMQEYGNRPTTIIVDAGTPIGILFLGDENR
jgi:intracellular multiplication protein IcmE